MYFITYLAAYWIRLRFTQYNFVLVSICRKVLAQSEMLVLKDRELKETRNLYSAVKDMLALQPSPEIQVQHLISYLTILFSIYLRTDI